MPSFSSSASRRLFSQSCSWSQTGSPRRARGCRVRSCSHSRLPATSSSRSDSCRGAQEGQGHPLGTFLQAGREGGGHTKAGGCPEGSSQKPAALEQGGSPHRSPNHGPLCRSTQPLDGDGPGLPGCIVGGPPVAWLRPVGPALGGCHTAPRPPAASARAAPPPADVARPATW